MSAEWAGVTVAAIALGLGVFNLVWTWRRSRRETMESRKAHLRAHLVPARPNSGNYDKLILTNDGPGAARDIHTFLNGTPLNRTGWLRSRDYEIRGSLAAHSEYIYQISWKQVGPVEVRLHWADDSGEGDAVTSIPPHPAPPEPGYASTFDLPAS